MRRYSGGNIGGRNKDGQGIYSLAQQYNEKVDLNWPSQGSVYRNAVEREIQPSPDPWYRNPSWLTLTAVTSSDEKFVGLIGIDNPKDYVSFSATGNYTVNWGDGIIENYSSGAIASHEYDYNNIALADTNAPVTLTASTLTLTRASHGYSNGQQVKLSNIVGSTGLRTSFYYVINKTDNTFQISEDKNGTPVTFTGDGTATLLPYKQAIITVTPQAGQQLTTLNLQEYHPKRSSGAGSYTVNWLDIVVSGPNFNSTGLTINTQTSYYGTSKIYLRSLEQVKIKNLGGQTSMSYMFAFMPVFSSYEISNANSVTNYNYMFLRCYQLYEAPAFTLNANSTVDSMFSFCRRLTSIGNFDFSPVTSAAGLFEYTNIYNFPDLNFSNCSNLYSLFYNVPTLSVIPKMTLATPFDGSYMFYGTNIEEFDDTIDLSKCTNAEGMFSGTYALNTVTISNLGSVTNMNYMFGYSGIKKAKINDISSLVSVNYAILDTCNSIDEFEITSKTAPLLQKLRIADSCEALRKVNILEGTSLPSLTDVSYLFTLVPSLRSINLFDTSNVTNMASMFDQCYGLTRIPHFDTSNVTDMSYMFNNCPALEEIPLFDTSNVTNMSNMFVNCCSLLEVPHFDTSNVTNMYQMFKQTTSLRTIPKFNTSKVTDFGGMFWQPDPTNTTYSGGLEYFPDLDMSSATSVGSMFYGCVNLKSFESNYMNLPLISDISYMFYNCIGITEIPKMNLKSSAVSFTAQNSFFNCQSLKKLPDGIFNYPVPIAAVGSYGVISGCYSLTNFPKMNLINETYSWAGPFSTPTSSYNLSNVEVYNSIVDMNFTGSKLEPEAISYIIDITAKSYPWASARPITFTGNPGLVNNITTITVSKMNVGSNVVMCSDTSNLSVGMEVYGRGVSAYIPDLSSANASAYQVYFNNSNNQIIRTNHGLKENTMVTYGGVTFQDSKTPFTNEAGYGTIFYVVNPTSNTFQISTSKKGTANTFLANANGYIYVNHTIESINPGVSFTLNAKVNVSGNITSTTLVASNASLNFGKAHLKYLTLVV